MERSMAVSLNWPVALPAAEEPVPLVFEALYAHYFKRVWRTLRRLGISDAHLDDAAQDVFLIVHRKLGGFDGRSMRGWLYAITVRVASDYRRNTARRATAPLPESTASSAPGPARQSELNESVALLHALLESLDEPKRTVFVLAELEQLSIVEIAELLGENLNTVYSRQRAARAQFEAALERHKRREGDRK